MITRFIRDILKKPPTDALHPIILDNACILCLTAATGTELVETYSPDIIIASSLEKEVHDLWAFFHAALLRQAFAHCEKFPTATSENICVAQQSKMMRMKTRRNEVSRMTGGGSSSGGDKEWELRPGGMLVQKRTDSDQNLVPPPTIRVHVKYGSIYNQIRISSQATFGELKKMLTGPTGLHHQDQKLYYKDKERDSNAFLDSSGVKDKSKIVLVEDTIGKEKRFLEIKKMAKIEKDKKLISEISLEVDRLAGQVSALESVISRGRKVAEKDVLNLIELLMNQLVKLDGVIGDGDIKLQRTMQAKRVQKYVETLDMLKVNNSITTSVYSNGLVSSSPPVQHNNYSKPEHSSSGSTATS
ncbi:BAG family molecular chaperone regulator 1 [Abeliophyllum distichum]|uniref:BAG family molecular chaperone regulator 1 n=1 Tax=Abeliophyllum distichum TaxID=126358 RepID=A0ABD1UQB0_9LAMI